MELHIRIQILSTSLLAKKEDRLLTLFSSELIIGPKIFLEYYYLGKKNNNNKTLFFVETKKNISMVSDVLLFKQFDT